MIASSTWSRERLDRLGPRGRPALKSGPFGSSLTKASYVDKGYKVYGQQEVLTRSLEATAYLISERSFRSHERCAVEPGDVLITTMGTLGRTFVVPEGAPAGIINPRLIRIAVDTSRVDPNYLDAFLSSPQAQTSLARSAHGGTMSGLNSRTLGALLVPLPSLSEQRKIAEVLRSWDQAIEACTGLATTRRRKLQSWSDSAFRATRNSQVHPMRLGDLFDERTETTSSSLPLLSVTQQNGVVRQDAAGRKDSSSSDRSRYKRVRPGDVAYNTMRMWQGASGLVTEEGIVSPAYTVVTPRTNLIDPHYAVSLFKDGRMKFDFERYSQGLTSDTWNLKFPAFAEIAVSIPALDIQRRFATYLQSANTELALINREIALLKQQKRGLMQKLLTGDIRVYVDSTEEAHP